MSPRLVRRAEPAGIAMITVIVVLVAMALVATPFAVSMRNLESASLLSEQRERARAGAEVALAAARRHLEETHPFLDLATPRQDTRAELMPDDLAERFGDLLPRDPRGSIRSVRIADERGKIHLGSAPPWLLGRLLGGVSFLTAEAAADDRSLALASTDGFEPSGLALVGGELVEYSGTETNLLRDVNRGYASANVPRSRAVSHALGTQVLDARLVLLAQRAWMLRPGVFEPYRRVEGLKDLGFFGEMTYTAEDLDRVADDLSVHGAPPRWGDAQRLLDVRQSTDGGHELVVADGRRLGPGSVLRLRDRENGDSFQLVLACTDWGDGWHVRVLEPVTARAGRTSVSVLAREPVNLNTASPRVLAALFTGLATAPVRDVVNDLEAAHLALLITERNLDASRMELVDLLEDEIEDGLFSRFDVAAASDTLVAEDVRPGELEVEELALLLAGSESRGSSRRLAPTTAAELARRVAEARPGSHEDLRDVLSVALADGACTPDERVNILRNALHPGDARLVGGTLPFTYESAGIFRLQAAAIENLPNGRERARAHVDQVVAVAPSGETARLLESQADFQAHLTPGGAWVTGPNPLRSGPGPAVPRTEEQRREGRVSGRDRDDVGGVDVAMAHELAAEPVGRAETLASGRAGASDDPAYSELRLATDRSGLPGTIHFDEGALGLTGTRLDGLDLAAAPLALPLADLTPALTAPVTGLLQPFSVEFWVTFEDVGAETVLFDLGQDHLEDRISLMLREGVLVLRVADTSLADFDTPLDDGLDPAAGEIRYAFDDGLELLPDVPYHVMVHVAGARSTQLALFVDGVPRGQRRFVTRLTADVDAAGTSGPGAAVGRTYKIQVESTAGFPTNGVLRIGQELLEYIDKRDDHFIVRSAGTNDPFGGRARRGSTGNVHEASELVELVGYTRPLASGEAAQGDGSLRGELGAFAIAELDPNQLNDDIIVEVTPTVGAGGGVPTPIQFSLGTGLLETATTIPVRGLNGGGLAPGTFQTGGGHAVIFCDYGGNQLIGQNVIPPGAQNAGEVLGTTVTGAFIGGAEMIQYTGFDGQNLTGCSRADQGLPQSTGPQPSPLSANASQQHVTRQQSTWGDLRAFVTTLSPDVTGSSQQPLPEVVRVAVIPVSIATTDSANGFHPFPNNLASFDSYFAQIDVDFTDSGGTEWVRWNTPTSTALVRDEPQALDDALGVIRSYQNNEFWNGDTVTVDDDLVDDVNAALDFRGQAGTGDWVHGDGTQVLPVHAVGGFWQANGMQPALGQPGRHDVVTLVSPAGDREQHVINHAMTGDPGKGDWNNSFSLVAFRAAVRDPFGYTPESLEANWVVADRQVGRVAADSPQALRVMEEHQFSRPDALEDWARRFNPDSRMVTRLIKGPSGELPSAELATFHFGQTFDERPSAGAARIDELRLHTSGVPGALLPPNTRYVLDGELEFDEDQALVLDTQALYTSHTLLRNADLGKDLLEVLSELPGAGGLLLIDEEIVSYTGLDPLESGAVFLSGRGLFGTRRARHEWRTPVIPLMVWPASPLTERIREDDAVIPVAEPQLFPPEGGLVWVDEELLAYTGISEDGLTMPVRGGFSEEGVLRGRFGTAPAQHGIGALVRWQPRRVLDQSLLGVDVPEARLGRLGVHAPGAFFTDVSVRGQVPDRLLELDARVILDDRAPVHADPDATPFLWRLPDDEVSPGLRSLRLGETGDRLELVLGVRYLPGAFDPVHAASNAWKLSPSLDAIVIRHHQPSLVLEHSEWR